MSFWDFLARPLYFQDHLFMWSHKSVLPGIKLCIMAKHTMVAPINAIWGTTAGSYGPVLRVTTRSNWLKGYSDSNILTRCHGALDHGFNLRWNITLKLTIAAHREVSVDAAKASVNTELESLFHQMKSKERHWGLLSMENVFSVFLRVVRFTSWLHKNYLLFICLVKVSHWLTLIDK